jgi:hypothetical protein
VLPLSEHRSGGASNITVSTTLAPAACSRYPEAMADRLLIEPSEALLDAAVESTFPASDPISVDHAFNAAREREERDAGSSPKPLRQSSAE